MEKFETPTDPASSRNTWRSDVRSIFVDTIAWLATSAAYAPAQGYVLMIGVDVVHSTWIHAVPTIGYIGAVIVCYLLSILVQMQTARH